jgi:UDP-2-acetamido-3-amino-2,3-dideoxy-glucuronate N-acetyltransferase
MNYFVHPQAICESETIGENTRIWAFTHVLAKAKIGSDCNLCDHVFIENDVVVGNRVTIKCGVQLWDGVTLEDDVFVGPNVTFTNDMYPRSKQYPATFAKTLVRSGASIGANATILPGISIGKMAMIGAGSVVTRDIPSYAKVVGNPARIVGYTNKESLPCHIPKEPAITKDSPLQSLRVKGVTLHEMPFVKDIRGNLSVGEFERNVPFIPQRYFMVTDVPTGKIRGEHAHKECHQFLICIKGSCSVVVDDGEIREEIILDRLNKGLYLPPMIWGVQYKYSTDAVLLVFASDYYDASDYIRDYDEFQGLVNAEN